MADADLSHEAARNKLTLAGVYIIVHIPSGRRYVGSAARSFKHRWNGHKTDLKRGVHHSKWMQRIYNKYGADVFRFEIALVCRPEDCLLYEQQVIDLYKPEFNTSPTAGSALGVKASHQRKSRLKASWQNRIERFEIRGEMLTRKEIVGRFSHLTYDAIQHRVRNGKRGEDLIAPLVENFPHSAIMNGHKFAAERNIANAERYEVNGERLRVAEIAEKSGCSTATIRQRIRAGWRGIELLRPPGEKAIKSGSSGVKGVHWHSASKKWCAYFERKGMKRVTYHSSIDEAAASYSKSEEVYRRKFA